MLRNKPNEAERQQNEGTGKETGEGTMAVVGGEKAAGGASGSKHCGLRVNDCFIASVLLCLSSGSFIPCPASLLHEIRDASCSITQ